MRVTVSTIVAMPEVHFSPPHKRSWTWAVESAVTNGCGDIKSGSGKLNDRLVLGSYVYSLAIAT